MLSMYLFGLQIDKIPVKISKSHLKTKIQRPNVLLESFD